MRCRCCCRHHFVAAFFVMTVVLDKPGWLTSRQVRRLDREGMTIAPHTYDHPEAFAHLDGAGYVAAFQLAGKLDRRHPLWTLRRIIVPELSSASCSRRSSTTLERPSRCPLPPRAGSAPPRVAAAPDAFSSPCGGSDRRPRRRA
jgi:hypothetical protein